MPGVITETMGTNRRGRRVRAENVDNKKCTVAMPAGVLVTPTSSDGIKLPTSGAEVIAGAGVSMYISSKTPVAGSDLEFAAADVVPYIFHGDVDVIVEEAVTPASAVFARHTANGAGKLQLGAFRTDADSGNATLVSGACFISSGSTVATLRINKPSADASVAAAFERKALRRTFSYLDTDIDIAATSAVITFGDPLPINAVVESVHMNVTADFAVGGGTFTLDVGVLSGDDDRFTPTAIAIDGGIAEHNQTVNLPGNNSGATTQLAVTVAGSVNLGTLTSGEGVLTVYYYVPSSITVVAAP